jgi:hypothetical protein
VTKQHALLEHAERRVGAADLSDVPEPWRDVLTLAMLTLVTWCAQRGGRVPRDALHAIAGGGQEAVAARLVAAGALHKIGGAYILAEAPPLARCEPAAAIIALPRRLAR